MMITIKDLAEQSKDSDFKRLCFEYLPLKFSRRHGDPSRPWNRMIHKFLNATTFEGYNPYRVTKGGFDWEVIEEHDPWSYIGYWGDHQIIYLLKFLECIENHYPGQLEKRFSDSII